MSPHDPGEGGGGGGGRALLSGALILPVFSAKTFDNFGSIRRGGQGTTFYYSLRRTDFQKAIFIFLLVVGPHVGPMQTVCPCNGPGGRVLKRGPIRPLPPPLEHLPFWWHKHLPHRAPLRVHCVPRRL